MTSWLEPTLQETKTTGDSPSSALKRRGTVPHFVKALNRQIVLESY